MSSPHTILKVSEIPYQCARLTELLPATGGALFSLPGPALILTLKVDA